MRAWGSCGGVERALLELGAVEVVDKVGEIVVAVFAGPGGGFGQESDVPHGRHKKLCGFGPSGAGGGAEGARAAPVARVGVAGRQQQAQNLDRSGICGAEKGRSAVAVAGGGVACGKQKGGGG